MQPKLIKACLTTEEGNIFKFPACLFSESVAFVIFDEHLEIHQVKPLDDPNEYEIAKATNAIFHVGSDHPSVLDDLVNLSLVGFARKYMPSDFYDPNNFGVTTI